MKRFFKIAAPLLIILIGIGGILSYDFYFKDKINTVDVVVAKQDINFKDKITSENIQIVSIRKDNAVNGVVNPKDVDTILDHNAAIDIKKGTQIYTDLVDTYDLVPNEKEGEFIAPIPDEWLFAVPGSLRKTFIADFYAIPDKEQAVIRSLVQEAKDQKDGKSDSDSKDQKEDKDSDVPISSTDSIDTMITKNNEPIVKNVRVASVKDGSNKEVTESKEDNESATGTVSNLEIISNDETLSTLRTYTEQGYKIYVVYKFER
ncbi:SAF domain-containing protein [Heyndrickxia sporothermodurans]|uniref:SAF domain-containing protein n=1 Tax=Heyndrickxia sporothermodurans TaxID=46224 RepID=A0AB37HCG4_9BACI|nr:SAF domain-containing protein [Heyndrickxia sporothermodurans]MBL5768662.1 SAF domain-containing protein [Heyndrickxia sporothermodurans]MBL5772380.1 SAF domain-containing protein [Heyndrickxia sporothermodurans]MBL5775927.1 SAF domain-containing protein [Heyndrickxia sporothermodurans]MBL5779813.1 SAF domain-containing protein [Heyndrickxia sporothermodurans]MBL5782802.1 SAF domain-containing protein [Heyndrickxia sporothermodurans]